MGIKEKLHFFQDMMNCCHNLYFWCYDKDRTLLCSTCQEDWLFHTAFFINEPKDLLSSNSYDNEKPLILENEYHMFWIVVPEKENERLVFFHVMGPFFTSDHPLKEIKAQLNHRQFSLSTIRKSTEFVKQLPIISINRVFEYTVMFYYCITGKKISISDLHYQEATEKIPILKKEEASAETHGTYEAEQEMLRMVREGDLNYKNHMNKISMTGRVGKLSNDTSMRQLKNTVLVCVILFSRAAIEGGLSPEISYTLADNYFQSIDACNSMPDLIDISHTMQADFVERVHKCQQNPDYSAEIRSCIEYIEFHLEDKIAIEALAKNTGYTDYYLSKKFKKETGINIKTYIRNARMERAKYLLTKTNASVQEIGERLQFCSQSYFTDTFRKETGMTPSEYRNH